MQDVDILTKIIRYCSCTTYVPKEVEGYTKEVYEHAKAFEQGIAHAKEKILEIINSEKNSYGNNNLHYGNAERNRIAIQ